jgi:hypothetical protein
VSRYLNKRNNQQEKAILPIHGKGTADQGKTVLTTTREGVFSDKVVSEYLLENGADRFLSKIGGESQRKYRRP